jgi:diguanylate cyclase (GGDEF)-like protein
MMMATGRFLAGILFTPPWREKAGDYRCEGVRGKQKRQSMVKKIGGPTQKAVPAPADVRALRRELTRLRARISELEATTDEDPLTGLLNRRGFDRELNRAFAFVRRYASTMALLYLDLDGFKAVNDKHGHAAGDQVLKRVVQLICGRVRASDVVARVGGDEFVVLMWNLKEHDAEARAEALEALVGAAVFEHEGKVLKLGVSISVSHLRPDELLAPFISRADERMYARKRARRSARPSAA